MIMNSFTVKPRHWWQYLSPWFWKRKKIAEALLKYELENGLEKMVEEKYRRNILFGEPGE